MREIALSKGHVALVDDEDYGSVSAHKWCAVESHSRRDGSRVVYARRNLPNIGGERKAMYLHRFILEAPEGMLVDHIDGNPLNNTRTNLRLCTPSENARNRGPRVNQTSEYHGVCWHKRESLWGAQVAPGGKRICLGYYRDEEAAAAAYDSAAVEHYGEHAKLNFLRRAS